MNEIFQVAGCMNEAKINRKNHIQIKIESQENISPEAMKRFCEMVNQLGYFTFNVHQIEAQDIIDLPPLRATDDSKKPSERQRAVLYRLWEQDNEGFKDSDSHYRFYMEKIIDWLKKKLD
jgi:hypothetical protein